MKIFAYLKLDYHCPLLTYLVGHSHRLAPFSPSSNKAPPHLRRLENWDFLCWKSRKWLWAERGWTTGKMWNWLLEEILRGEGGLQERGIGNRRNYDQNTFFKQIFLGLLMASEYLRKPKKRPVSLKLLPIAQTVFCFGLVWLFAYNTILALPHLDHGFLSLKLLNAAVVHRRHGITNVHKTQCLYLSFTSSAQPFPPPFSALVTMQSELYEPYQQTPTLSGLCWGLAMRCTSRRLQKGRKMRPGYLLLWLPPRKSTSVGCILSWKVIIPFPQAPVHGSPSGFWWPLWTFIPSSHILSGA